MSATERSSYDDLLSLLYDAVMAPGGFQGFIEAFCSVFRLKAATLLIRHVNTQEMKGLWVHGIAKEWFESYALEYASEDILAHHMTASPIALFYASNLDLPHPERFPENRFYREWIEPQGVAYAAGGIVLREGAWVTEFFLQRAPEHLAFMREELNEFNQVIPHLQRAIQMRQRFTELQLGHSFMSGSLDVLAMPTLLFDEYSRVVHTNRNANALLSSGISLSIEGGHLFTSDAAATRGLNLELTNAIRASRGSGAELAGVVLLPRLERLPLMLMIAPLRLAGAFPVQGAALLFIFDPEMTPTITSDLVRRLFGLSEAEAELAVALCSGKTLDDVAKERGTSMNTIKSQIKSIFLKTGTKRQSELVSLLLASPAYFLEQKRYPG
ncbi:helix-turn-helix transcriptional regulator [Collimonas silvisoli]|uniref:helix-turn-helix transcriptional regulator n=1 Tax=Collimonas silvisoli TaxID=2825884 RepID=UPI001B8D4162|nr:helix-turn-helix transcriptional regulator [Collimonas silvisoli]